MTKYALCSHCFVAEFIKTVLSKTPEIVQYIDSNINIY